MKPWLTQAGGGASLCAGIRIYLWADGVERGVELLRLAHAAQLFEWVGLAQYEKPGYGSLVGGAQEPGHLGVGYVGGSLAIGVLLAVLLDSEDPLRGALRTIYLYPMALSFVVTGTAWKWLLNPGLGIEKNGADWGFPNFEFGWLVDTDMAIYCVVIAGIWQSAGFAMALFWPGCAALTTASSRPRRSMVPRCRAFTGASCRQPCARCSSPRSWCCRTWPSRALTW